jgi:hypothetical protein
MNTLYLSKAEQKLWNAFPEALREGWNVETEGNDGYETDDELRMNTCLTTMHKYEAVQEMLNAASNGKEISLSLAGVPDEAALDFFFTIGARGIANLIATLMASAFTDNDIMTLSALAEARHEILTVNRLPLAA